MKLYIGADHNGYAMKAELKDFLKRSAYEVVDIGGQTLSPDDDFTGYAQALTIQLLNDPDKSSRGILICGSGQGMCMAANRFRGIRASLCWNIAEARSARNDDDSNVLCLSATYSTIEEIEPIITVFLSTPFAAAPRFIRRLQALDQL